MKILETVELASKDEGFSRELQEKAEKAARDGVGSKAWEELARYFADDEKELAYLTAPLQRTKDFDPFTTKLLLLQTLHGAISTTTTTTTTTTTLSRLCAGRDSFRASAVRKPKKSSKKAGSSKSAAESSKKRRG